MNRRDFIRIGLALPLAASLPGRSQAAGRQRTLVLVELKGGNDGLNTVVPYMDPDYYRLRPNLAIPRDHVIPLGEGLGLHPQLEALDELWQSGELAIALGVGYPDPNRSHFRSIDIWESGSGSSETLDEGWLAPLFRDHPQLKGAVVDGVVLDGDSGPLSGEGLRSIVMERPERFFRQARRLAALPAAGNAALLHLSKVQNAIRLAADDLEKRLRRSRDVGVFPNTRLGRQLKVAAQLITSDGQVPVIKTALPGFDTHRNQAGIHGRLMKELAEALHAFRLSLSASGHWNRVLVMTYSEFGRRVKENGSRGTDHGTAAPHFLLGGAVKGGLYGHQPPLTDLDAGDLRYQLDYRRLYATVADSWWGLGEGFRGFRGLPCIRS